MSNNTDNLIISVSNALKNFAEGKLSNEKAGNEYQKLLLQYEKIIKKRRKSNTADQLGGLCYHNNIENYSLLTGIYNAGHNDIICVTAYGDNSLNSEIMNVILKNRSNIIENQILQIPPGENNTFLHTIYLYPAFSNKTAKTIFASASSSSFFSEDKFLFLGKLVKNIFSVVLDEPEGFENNYFISISNEIENYIENNMDNEHSIRVTIFVFNMLEKIFNHMGMHSLLEASEGILNIIKENYRYNSQCFALSIRDYIVLERINKNDTGKDNKKKPEFSYKNINIPYNSLKIMIDTKEPIYSLWDKILTFENYLSTGDIIK